MKASIWDAGPGVEEGGVPEIWVSFDGVSTIEEAKAAVVALCASDEDLSCGDRDDGGIWVDNGGECWLAEMPIEVLQRAIDEGEAECY